MARGVSLHNLTRPQRPLRESAPVLLVRLSELMEWTSAIHDPACVEELHNMRIAAKRLRYTLELFAPVLGPPSAPVLALVTAMQEQIGAIHDCDMMMPLLQETLDKEMKRERKRLLRRGSEPPPHLAAEGLLALMHRKTEERDQCYRKFIAWWDALPPDTFAAQVTALVPSILLENTRSQGLPDAT